MPKKTEQKQIPAEIIDLIQSEKTSLAISEICLSNNIEGENIEQVAYQTARVLLNNVQPEMFAKELEKQEGFASETARNIAEEIDARIFSQMRKILDKKPAEEIKKSVEKTPTDDTYRENIE